MHQMTLHAHPGGSATAALCSPKVNQATLFIRKVTCPNCAVIRDTLLELGFGIVEVSRWDKLDAHWEDPIFTMSGRAWPTGRELAREGMAWVKWPDGIQRLTKLGEMRDENIYGDGTIEPGGVWRYNPTSSPDQARNRGLRANRGPAPSEPFRRQRRP